MSVYFLTEKWIKENFSLPNVSATDIRPWIKPACDINIMPVLGSEFYNYLVSGFTNNTLSAQEVLLVDVIKPTALYFTISQFLTFNTYPVKNIGSQKSRTDYSNHADDSNLKVLPYQKNEIDGLAGFYLSQLQLFLKDNKALYPQYTNPSNYDDGISPSTTQNYSFGIIIPPSNNCSRY